MRILFTSLRRQGRLHVLWTPAEAHVGRIIGKVGKRIVSDDVPGRAAQLSYYFLLSLFPLLVFLFALLGSVFRAEVEIEAKVLGYLWGVMPSAAFEVVLATTADLTRGGSGGKLSFGLLLALWMASSGMEAVIEGLNVAYRVSEWRPWWRRRALALALSLGVAAAIIVSLGLILLGGRIGERVPESLQVGPTLRPFWAIARWATALVLLLSSITLLYRLAPNVGKGRSRVLWPGALVALAGWFAASAMLRWYLGSFSTLGATYGSLAAVIALLIWLYLTGSVLLVGGIVNCEIGLETGERH
jgi:membrane protein